MKGRLAKIVVGISVGVVIGGMAGYVAGGLTAAGATTSHETSVVRRHHQDASKSKGSRQSAKAAAGRESSSMGTFEFGAPGSNNHADSKAESDDRESNDNESDDTFDSADHESEGSGTGSSWLPGWPGGDGGSGD